MHAFVPIKWVQLYVTNAEVMCKGTDRTGNALLSVNCLRWPFVFAMLVDYGMIREKEWMEKVFLFFALLSE